MQRGVEIFRIATLAAVGALGLLLPGVPQAETEEAPGPVAPFRLEGLDGRVFDSSQRLPGKVTLISFWRLGQKYSTRLLEDLVSLRGEFSAEDVVFVTVISGETDPGQARDLVQELELSFPVLLDPDRSLYGAFGIVVSPSSWFIDSDGNRRFAYPGHRRDFAVVARANIELLLGRISERQREATLAKKEAPRTKGTIGGPVRYRMAQKLLASGRREAGMKGLMQAWRAVPRFPAAGVDLGLLLLEEGKSQEALEILQEAAELLPEDPRAQGAAGVALIRSGAADEGGERLRGALEAGAGEPIFFYEMAVLSEGRGAAEEACHYYRAGLERMLGKERQAPDPSAPKGAEEEETGP